MSSSTDPAATSFPLSMTTAWVQICSTSARMWLENNTVEPASDTRRTSWRTSRISPGSSPLVGSSSTSTSGRPSSTRASPNRCRIPCEYVFTLRSMAEPRSAIAERGVDVGVGPLVPAGIPPETQVAHPGEVGHERGGLDEGADPPQLIGAGTDPFTEDPHLPSRGPDETEEHAQARGLARAVRAEQAADLPAFDAEREVVDREHARAEALREPDDLDDCFGHRPRSRPERRGGSTPASVAWPR